MFTLNLASCTHSPCKNPPQTLICGSGIPSAITTVYLEWGIMQCFVCSIGCTLGLSGCVHRQLDPTPSKHNSHRQRPDKSFRKAGQAHSVLLNEYEVCELRLTECIQCKPGKNIV